MINQHILPAFRVHRHSMGCSAISVEVGWGSLAKFSVMGIDLETVQVFLFESFTEWILVAGESLSKSQSYLEQWIPCVAKNWTSPAGKEYSTHVLRGLCPLLLLWHAEGDGTPIQAFGITYSLLKGKVVVSLAFGLCTTGHTLGMEEAAVNWATGVQSGGSDNYTDHNEDLVWTNQL